MKRGKIRIIVGLLLIILQAASMINQSSSLQIHDGNILYTVAFGIGFFSIGITGTMLLFYGMKAHSDALRSQLVLHIRTNKVHTTIKWITFGISAILFTVYLWVFVYYLSYFDIFLLLMIFVNFSFMLYMLFYVYRKPCCLFSTVLTLMGVAYLYLFIVNSNSIKYMDSYSLYFMLKFVIGILYIIIATKLYKENFSVKTIRWLARIAFVIELISLIIDVIESDYSHIFNINVYNSIDTAILALSIFSYYIYPIVLSFCIFLYTGVLGINTLQETVTVMVDNDDIIKFCRKCGEKLIDNSQFCRKCGTEIVDIQKGID